jgi:leader peptidase (prepilin peptidase)/N-methyltransferase
LWQIQLVAPPILIAVLTFLFGLIIGSFLNVCIVRIPRDKSIVLPSSACVKCGAAIRPYDNIPVLSYLLLAGRCRQCKTRISPIY